MSAPDPPFDPCVCTALRKTTRAVTRVYDEALAEHDLTTTQFAILRHLSTDREIALIRLAGLLVMDRTTLYRTLTPLERRGLIVVRATGPRAKAATLTAAGAECREQARRSWASAQDRTTAVIGLAAWAALEKQLAALTDAITS